MATWYPSRPARGAPGSVTELPRPALRWRARTSRTRQEARRADGERPPRAVIGVERPTPRRGPHLPVVGPVREPRQRASGPPAVGPTTLRRTRCCSSLSQQTKYRRPGSADHSSVTELARPEVPLAGESLGERRLGPPGPTRNDHHGSAVAVGFGPAAFRARTCQEYSPFARPLSAEEVAVAHGHPCGATRAVVGRVVADLVRVAPLGRPPCRVFSELAKPVAPFAGDTFPNAEGGGAAATVKAHTSPASARSCSSHFAARTCSSTCPHQAASAPRRSPCPHRHPCRATRAVVSRVVADLVRGGPRSTSPRQRHGAAKARRPVGGDVLPERRWRRPRADAERPPRAAVSLEGPSEVAARHLPVVGAVGKSVSVRRRWPHSATKPRHTRCCSSCPAHRVARIRQRRPRKVTVLPSPSCRSPSGLGKMSAGPVPPERTTTFRCRRRLSRPRSGPATCQ